VIRLAVFDIAGTTVHDGDAVNVSFANALGAAGVERSRDEINAVMGLAKPRAIDLLLDPMPADAPAPAATGAEARAARKARIEAIHRDFADRMIAHYNKSPAVREIDGAADVFKALKSAGVRVALDTGFDRRIANAVLRRMRWIALGLVDVTVTSDEVIDGRPAPDMIFRAMTLAGVGRAEDVAKVGDTPSDLHEGTNAGCGTVVGFTGGTHTHDELAGAPHTHLIANLRDFLDIAGIKRGRHVRAL
jgi:phosphonatase-like hydrolase